jgi:type IV pilus assembly protein PilO
MGARHADRIWMIAGATVTVLLVIASWFLLISPKYAAKDEVDGQIADTQTQLITLRKRIAELKKQQENLPALKATLAKKQTAIPSDSGIPAFLNQLTKSGTDTNVTVTGISVSAPVQQANLSAVKALPITLAAAGTIADVEKFLDTLQTGQSRAVLIQSANVSPDSGADSDSSDTASSTTDPAPDSSDAASSTVSISLTLEAFVTSTSSTGATTVTTK